jgi:hypothetical protein
VSACRHAIPPLAISGSLRPGVYKIGNGSGLRRFARRGLAAVQAELSFACAVTNLLKIATKGITTTQLQAG